MNKKRNLAIILSIIATLIGYYFLSNNINNSFELFRIENLVGIIAILSGIAGIVMGISSVRHASLDAVKEYFQQGDEDSYSSARKRILEVKNISENEYSAVSKVCNFFHFWGLMNRQRYLPIWVFDGSSGLQIIKLYMKLDPIITEKRNNNKFYAIEFEFLAYRIYKKYKSNFDDLMDSEWKEMFQKFKLNSKKSFSKRYESI